MSRIIDRHEWEYWRRMGGVVRASGGCCPSQDEMTHMRLTVPLIIARWTEYYQALATGWREEDERRRGSTAD